MKKVCGDTLQKWEGANYKARQKIYHRVNAYQYLKKKKKQIGSIKHSKTLKNQFSTLNDC